MPAYRLVIVDDHPLFRGALNQALSQAFAGSTILEAGSLAELTDVLAADADVDLVLLDLNMPGVQGLSGLLFLRAEHPEIPVVIVSASEDAATIRRAIDFGASGYVPPPHVDLTAPADKSTSDLVARLSTLTPQQVRVLMMLGEGLLNKQIAYQLTVSEATIKAHVSAILQKLGVDSRTQAVIAISRIGGDWAKSG